MPGKRWQRWGAASGIVFVVFLVVGFVLATAAGQPDFDDPQDEINAFYDDNGALLGLSTRLFIVPSVFFLLAFLEGLRSLPRRSNGETSPLSALVLGGGIATAVLILASRVPTEVAIHEGEKGRLTSELARSTISATHFSPTAQLRSPSFSVRLRH